ncbi:MAG: HIT domain-containing protein [Mycoplasmataceae bacterium]|nr:HIT domain-containing protein [Mycoplasmataceae bacterium]
MEKNIFEKIINNDLPALKVYEDESFIAILDINPKNMGHTLLIPKQKQKDIFAENDETRSKLINIGTLLGEKIKTNLKADGIKFVINNGKEAGQVIFQTHLHIIPYYKKTQRNINDESVKQKIIGN